MALRAELPADLSLVRPMSDERRNGWLWAGYGGLLGFFALERGLRRAGSASSLQRTEADRGTTRIIVAAYAVAFELPLITRRLRGGRLGAKLALTGLVAEGVGLAVRAWSMQELGASYTRRLKTEEAEQPLIESGPYRIVRHPGYLGSLLTWTGFSLTSQSLPTAAAVSAVLGAAYAKRITVEEQMLRRELPGYEQYAQRTSRLVPLLW